MLKEAVEKYIQEISNKFVHETTSEYGYRTPFEILLKEIFAELDVQDIGHDDKTKGGNKPDFVIRKNEVPLLYIEAKDFGVSLDKIEKSDQMSRYFGYDNLVLSDYVEFRFYRLGVPYGEPVKIADYDLKTRTITPKSENYEYLAQTLLDFTKSHKEPIKSGAHLAKIMGGKAQRIRDNLREFLKNDSERNNELTKIYETIKKLLVHDIDKNEFADMYSQTLVYGLFVARFYDESPKTFTRQEARDLIPASNPLLRHFFDHIVGPNFDKRLEYIVNELCEVFAHADIEKLMQDYYRNSGDTKKGPDPVIHFYEDFLKEYDPALRKRMGAYYTPLPVVKFITGSVDYLLQKDFKLAGGLANTSKTKDGVHKVQVLDPAVGTGTFYSAVIGEIYKKFKDQKGRWPTYVHNDLLPRIHGFELMMAPYTIAHLKLALAFKETGFKYFNKRLNLFLTNSLENEVTQGDLFTAFGLAESIAEESKEAAKIKNDTPIMVVIGNPPYSVSSSNKGKWIQDLIKVYKQGLNEQNINSLSDDYVKFLRFAEHFIEKNGSGIVAMITNNSFLDGITHRQMRKHLLETFDDIYVLNLHGDTKKKEVSPDGGADENVFDIQQGVSINIFVRKKTEKDGLGKIHYEDIFGKRNEKFDVLNKNNLKNTKWKDIRYSDPYYFFSPKDFEFENAYNSGFKLDESFIKYSAGVKFRKDGLLIKNHFSPESVSEMLNDMQSLPTSSLTQKYGFKETSDWKVSEKRNFFVPNDKNNITTVLYKPFDYRWSYYPINTINQIIPRGDSRLNLMKHFIHQANVGLITNRQIVNESWSHAEITQTISSHGTFYLGNKGQDYIFPLYLYQEDGTKTSNLKREIVDAIEKVVGKATPEDIFDYIYAVLHSPKYRARYKEFLKIDFPRVPYPKDKDTFKKLVKLGQELRTLHLLESQKVNKFITTYPIAGSDTVEKKPEYKDGDVYINDDQYFGNVPEVAWNFWIGGYQPAQKWLKDRKGRTLTNEDIEHYQKMVVALVETGRIMSEVDQISI